MNLKQLSNHLKLSQTTVSRALNGYPEVNENTRKRVLEAASQLNYSPNARAKGLATGKSMAIGHVIPVSAQHEMVNPIFGDFVSGAGETYSENGYDMMLTLVADQDEETAYRKIKARGNVDGIIVHGPKLTDSRIDLLIELDMPFVVHGRATNSGAEFTWIDINNRRAFERATRYLIDLRHTRIALINGLEEMDFAHRRRVGYLAALEESGLPTDPALMRSEEMTEVYGYRSACEMLDMPNPPTAFLISSIMTAIGVRRALEERGLQMGKDVSVITHDDDLSYMKNGSDVPIFTATRSSVRQAGKQSAQMLLDMINNKATQTQCLLEADLIIGSSTGPAPQA